MQWLVNHFPRLVSMLMSLYQSAHLRDRVYQLEDDWEILYTALEDCRRINRASASPNPLIESVATRALNKP